jgi:hypothetical protein
MNTRCADAGSAERGVLFDEKGSSVNNFFEIEGACVIFHVDYPLRSSEIRVWVM